MKSRMVVDKEFFAGLEKPVELANAMKDRIREFRTFLTSRGIIGLWQRKLTNFYGNSGTGNSSQAIIAGGSQGELSMIKINDLHSLLQEQLVIVTGSRAAGQAKAINSDTKSLKSAKIGTAVAEYYLTEKGWETNFVQMAAMALLLDEGFYDIFWNQHLGDPVLVNPETQSPEMSGDAVMRLHAPWNAARDMGMKVQDQKWHILSYRDNKFDLAAAFPKFSDKILSCMDDGLPSIPMNKIPEGSDAIFAHLLIADRTPALPEGRYALLIGDEIVLDTNLPYKPYPVGRLAAEDVIDGPMGYSAANDIMGPEQLTDGLHSIIASNEITFGGQNIAAPSGANLKTADIAKGLRVFELAPDLIDKLRPMEFCRTPTEVFNYIGLLQGKKERAVGSVASSIAAQASQGASGNSMALVQSQSISFNSGIQRSYFKTLSSGMTKLIEILATYADQPRVARIVGESKAAYLKEFEYTGKDLGAVSSIVYEVMNPLMQTVGGRLEFCRMMIDAGQIKSPKQLINVATTGQTEVLTQDDEADGMLILEENEALREGRPVKAVVTEIHSDHMKSHASLITQDAKEKDPELVERVLNHNMEHISLWMDASIKNPAILIATGQQPLPIPQMMPPGPGLTQPGSPPISPPPPGGPGMGKVMGVGQSDIQEKADSIKPPELPNIAGTKEKPTVPGVTTP